MGKLRVGLLLAAVAGLLALPGAAAADVTAVSGSAFGAQVVVPLVGTTTFASVTLPGTGGGPFTNSALSASSALGALGTLSTGALSTSTQGSLGVSGSATSSASAAYVDVDLVGLANLFTADLVQSTASSDASGSTSATTLTNAQFNGTALASSPSPNTTMSVAGVANLTLNETSGSFTPGPPESRTRTVTAVHITLLGGASPIDVRIAQAQSGATGSSFLAATFAGVSARRTARGALLRWRTAAEVNVLGFNVFRQAGQRRVRANRRLLAARAAVAGASYSFLDPRAPRRRAARYWVETVDLDGSRSWYGPVRIPSL
jgi:hypothetical protein